jgi:CHAD domain-containing protein
MSGVVRYRLDPTLPVEDEVGRVAGELLDDAARRLRNEPAPSVEDIHKSRTALKKFRSMLRLVAVDPPARATTPGRVARDAARRLSAQRDQAVMTSTCEGLVPVLAGAVAPRTILRVRAGLVSMSAALRSTGHGAAFELDVADDLDALALSTAMWSVDGDGFDALEDGLRSSYARGRDALADLADHPDAEELHELRKRVKDHWYHVRLLREVWPPVLTAWAAESRVVSEQLGDDHDLSVLAGVLSGEGPDLLGPDRPVVLGTIEERRGQLLAGIRAGAGRLYADKPGAFTRRLRGWWAEASAPISGRGDVPWTAP